MKPGASQRSGLLTAGAVLSILAGVFQIVEGWLMTMFYYDRPWFFWWPEFRSTLYVGPEHIGPVPELSPLPIWQVILGWLFVAMGIIAIAGGISALRRKSFCLSLAGAICVLPSMHYGIPAVIFVALGKR